jgi:hypothetical protein
MRRSAETYSMLGRNIWKEDRRTQHDLVVCTLTGFPVSPTCEFSIGGYIVNRKQQFVERRPEQGDYAVRKPNSDQASVVKPTQRDAIDWAKAHNPDGGQILVERVRNTDRGHPDKWRKP